MKAQTRKRIQLSHSFCPSCEKMGNLKKIVYGMPDSDFNFDKFKVGGCCVGENDPEIGCTNCGWEGMRNECRKEAQSSN